MNFESDHLYFRAPEYQPDGSFSVSDLDFYGNERSEWSLVRNGQEFLKLGAGYRAVFPVYCGICSTDLVRRFLPYPLPQVIGHEVIVKDGDRFCAVEINASHMARGLENNGDCPFCNQGIPSHCPDRLTLGINGLPGGFAPAMLAPVSALVELPKTIRPSTGTLIEPFAAAYHAVLSTPPESGQKVAVIGPRKLGSMVLASLSIYRKEHKIDFEITSVLKSSDLAETVKSLGADQVVLLKEKASLKEKFDLVFDTSGSEDGFELALRLSRSVVHLKSTTGKRTQGMDHLTDLVVDELALAHISRFDQRYHRANDPVARNNKTIYLSPGLDESTRQTIRKQVDPKRTIVELPLEDAFTIMQERPEQFFSQSDLPRFDIAVVRDLAEADGIIRPDRDREISLVRPRGIIYVDRIDSSLESKELHRALSKNGVELSSSRCGDFRIAIEALSRNPELIKVMEDELISAVYSLQDIQTAFEAARDSRSSIKVLVKTDKRL